MKCGVQVQGEVRLLQSTDHGVVCKQGVGRREKIMLRRKSC